MREHLVAKSHFPKISFSQLFVNFVFDWKKSSEMISYTQKYGIKNLIRILKNSLSLSAIEFQQSCNQLQAVTLGVQAAETKA